MAMQLERFLFRPNFQKTGYTGAIALNWTANKNWHPLNWNCGLNHLNNQSGTVKTARLGRAP